MRCLSWLMKLKKCYMSWLRKEGTGLEMLPELAHETKKELSELTQEIKKTLPEPTKETRNMLPELTQETKKVVLEVTKETENVLPELAQ